MFAGIPSGYCSQGRVLISPLLVKLTLAPGLIASVSVLQRRWGPSIGGMLTGTPVMAGPVLLALALDHDERFAGAAAGAGLQALIAVAAFIAAYAAAAARWGLPWLASLAVAFAAYAVAILLIMEFPLGLTGSFVCTMAAQWLALRSMPGRRDGDPLKRTGPPWWDIPLRMALAAALVVAVAALADAAGARLSGLMTPFPIATTVLVVFTHRHDGAAAAAGFLRGLILGMSSLAVFFAVASAALPAMGLAAGFLWSAVASLAVSTLVWWQSRR